ncbi:hypothetical protein Tcan_08964 [Toxocara canis]|uniref:G protein-coupled receptor n=1 Tax=Toxocara canis TaxID=6265 RepID=A0A0B2VS61_TOXCA|nr:hypothetical protein Tcan_08964 [Toxocara canis]
MSTAMGLNFKRADYVWVMTPPGLMFLMYAVIFARFRKMKIAAVAGTVSTGELQLNDVRRSTLVNGSTFLKRTNKRQKLSGESSLIIQAAIICAVLQCQTIGFNLVPIFSRLLPSSAGIWLNIVQNWMVICSIFVQPIVYFTFNTQIRKQTRDLLKKDLNCAHKIIRRIS